MNRLKISSILLIVAASLTQFFGCSSKDKGTTPTQTVVQMSGTVSFPSLTTSELSGVTIGFGNYESSLDASGAFRIQGNGHVVGVAMAYDEQQTPMLMSVCPDPSTDAHLEMDVHSTAITLAFLNPFICITDPNHAQEVIDRLEGLPELTYLEILLAEKLYANPEALGIEDDEIDASLSELVLAYFNSFPEEVAKRLATVSGALDGGTPKLATSPPEIDPDYTMSGLRLTWESGSTYKITNSYGRWCYCCTPDDTFFVFPNGDLLDWIRYDRPFPASERRFNMDVVAGEDTSWVELYGYGFSSSASNSWDNLSHTEKKYVHAGGITTVTMELFAPAISAICNVPRTFGNEKVAKLWSSTGWNFILDNAKIVQRLEEYIKADNPTGASWWLTKQIMSQAVTSADYRAFLASTVGLSLTGNMVTTLGRFVKIPFTALIATYNLTSVAKTMLAMSNANFTTNFKVWREWEDYGSVSGQVADNVSGNGIVGATVTLAGDDNNPQNPSHQVTTDAQGNYRFERIGVGEKTITAGKTGYRDGSVTAVIATNTTVTANIVLERQTGGFSGRVTNEVLIRNSVTPTTFQGAVDITAHRVGSSDVSGPHYANDGLYNISLPSGNWWVIASHDDYYPDSFSVSIPSDGSVQATRDLMLKPHPTMSGTIKLNMDNAGDYEQVYDIDFAEIGLANPAVYQNSCANNGAMSIMQLYAIRGQTNTVFDACFIGFNQSRISDADAVAVGGFENFGCPEQSSAVTVMFSTNRQHCTERNGTTPRLSFSYTSDTERSGCNCGIGAPGTIYLEKWGTQPGDMVIGSFVVSLAGWKRCSCIGTDTNQDGKDDHWDVDCAQARLEIQFRVIVGTDYLVTTNPN
jgi:hypothetical protein